MQLIVGLTGGIGSGKTAVSNRFAAHGICIVDADICARAVVEKGTHALHQIQLHFGDTIINSTGELDRAKLRALVFEDAEQKKWLEQLLHPLIFTEMMHQITAATSPYVILVSPLLIEAGQDAIVNRVLVIDAPEDAQLNRTITRDQNNSAQVKAIMATQASREQRLAHADDIIVNDGSLEKLDNEVARLHQHYLALASAT